jgi:hypothetical protein
MLVTVKKNSPKISAISMGRRENCHCSIGTLLKKIHACHCKKIRLKSLPSVCDKKDLPMLERYTVKNIFVA